MRKKEKHLAFLRAVVEGKKACFTRLFKMVDNKDRCPTDCWDPKRPIPGNQLYVHGKKK